MSLWTELPAGVRDSGALEALRETLEDLGRQGPGGVDLQTSEVTDVDGTWRVRSAVVDVPKLAGVAVDPATGRWGGGGAGSSTPLELTGTQVTVRFGQHLSGGTPGGGWHLDLDVPGVRLLVPHLRGATLATGVLRADPAHEQVRFLLPRLVLQFLQPAGGDLVFRLRSATPSAGPVENLVTAVRMSPEHALVGPGNAVGFAFRAAVLDLSSTNDPPGLPAGARAARGQWQGLHLPEVRLFVAPEGLPGLAVSAGVRDLWIGIGEHAGVTGSFAAEIVQGPQPVVSGRFLTPGGQIIRAVAGETVAVPDGSLFLVDVAGGLAPHVTHITVDGGGRRKTDRVVVSVPVTGTVTVGVTVTDAAGNTFPDVDFEARRREGDAGTTPGPAAPAAVRDLTPEAGHVVVVREGAADVTVRLDPPVPATWTGPGGTTGTGVEFTVPLTAGATVGVQARRSAATPIALDCWFLFDEPRPSQTTDAWWRNPDHTASAPSPDRDGPHRGESFTDLARRRKGDLGTTALEVDGYASFEADATRADLGDDAARKSYDVELSRRRLKACVAILTDLGYSVTPGRARGHEFARDGVVLDAGGVAPPPGDPSWWRARAYAERDAPVTVRADLSRAPAQPPINDLDPAPERVERPECVRRLGVEVELIRSTFVRCEIWGEFDVQTATESALAARGHGALGGRGSNSGDGICAFRVKLRVATDGRAWAVTGDFRALAADLDGLWQGNSATAGIDRTVLDTLGALAVMGPLAAGSAELTPAAGTLVQLGSLALGASAIVKTKVLTLRGAELLVSDGIIAPEGSTASDRGTQVSILLDVEVEFWFDLAVISVPEARPLRTRYQAVGIRGTRKPDSPGQYLPVPVFDPARGYELDIQPGALVAQEPLDEILRVLGVRVSRDNPTYLEVEAGISVPLGPVTIDTVRIRARLDAAEFPQITKLGATLDVPGTVHGSGWVQVTADGFQAAFDLTLVPLDVRAGATLAIKTCNGVTGLLIGIDVKFPLPLVLGSSGLGIFGFLGGLGVNYARWETPSPSPSPVPALAWLMAQLPRAGGVMDPQGWEHRPGSFAVAAGMLVGTLEGGYVVHLKGILLVELPGPRLLLVVKADVLSAPPGLRSKEQATFLAVLDIDFGRGTITLGLVADYTIDRILSIHVPVTAFFDTRNPERWLVDLGTYQDRVTVAVFDAIRGSGYLMVHGDGVSVPGLPQVSTGMGIATGFHLQAVLLGSKAVRLYVEVAAGFDAILGFDPFFLAGHVYVRGELMLFVVSIAVSADLELAVGRRVENQVETDHPYVHGKVCGRVDFFFFSVQACLELTIGSEPTPDLVPRDLVAGVTLVGRSPALVEGAAAGRSLDSSLGDCPEVRASHPSGEVPVVPLDAVPVIRFHDAPVADSLEVDGVLVRGTTGAKGAGAWRRIGERWWAYEVTRVVLDGGLTKGPQPATWWSQSRPGMIEQAPALALLDWLPTPFTSAIPLGETLTRQVEHRWSTVCDPAAPPVEVLWTFAAQRFGSSVEGWRLDGLPWPDPPGALRTVPSTRRLVVSEPWRTGDPQADLLQDTDPAVVVGDAVACIGGDTPRDDPFAVWRSGNGGQVPTTWNGPTLSFTAATDLLAATGSLLDLPAARHAQLPDPDLLKLAGCEGRVLQAPTGTSADPAPRGTAQDVERVLQERDRRHWVLDGLDDAVLLSAGEPVRRLTLLLLVPAETTRTLLVSARNADGVELDRREVDQSATVGAGNPLPGAWMDRSGPWAGPVERAGRVAAKIAEHAERYGLRLALVAWDDLPESTQGVAVGWDSISWVPGAQDRIRQTFHVVAVSALLGSEVRRYDRDSLIVTEDRDVLQSSLTQDPDDHALLRPGEEYRVRVDWTWASLESDTRPTSDPVFTGPPRTQEFIFTTETGAGPDDLGPWLLDSDPGTGDRDVFCREPLRMTLATQNVTRLFAAHGRRLEVTVLAASGRHPAPPAGGTAGTGVVLEEGASVLLAPVATPVLTSWAETVSTLVATKACVTGDGNSRPAVSVELRYSLEPLTDYVLDVHSVPIAGPIAGGEPAVRVHRVNFTTSRFDDLPHLASWIRHAPVDHRLVRDVAPLTALPAKPSGRQWDDAVHAAGLGVPAVPEAPRVEVWWSRDPLPQPVAVVVECSEQLVRERLVPTRVGGPTDAADPTHQWWAARPATSLELRPVTDPSDPGAAATTGPPVVAPGATRVLVRLAPGQRGQRVVLALVQPADDLAHLGERHADAVDVTLGRAPWEVED